MPTQSARDLAVKMKLTVIKEAVAGQRLIVVEDSVVRGTRGPYVLIIAAWIADTQRVLALMSTPLSL